MAFWGIYKKQRSLWLTALGLFGLIPLQLAYSAAVKPIPPPTLPRCSTEGRSPRRRRRERSAQAPIFTGG